MGAGRRLSFKIQPDEDLIQEFSDGEALSPRESMRERMFSRAGTIAEESLTEYEEGPMSRGPSQKANEKALIGLPRTVVTGVDHHDGSVGKQFFFQPDEWSDMIGAASSKTWKGKKYPIVQLREGKRIWRGEVIVKRAGSTCFGKRSSGEAFGQWEVGDLVILSNAGGWFSRNKWTVQDIIRLGAQVDMFDETILRLEQDGNVFDETNTTAVAALNSGAEICGEGICIVYSKSENEYFMCVRSDKKADGLRVFYDIEETVQEVLPEEDACSPRSRNKGEKVDYKYLADDVR